MKIVIGGSFNPITKGHLEMYHYLNKKFNNASFIYVPVSLKYAKDSLLANIDRYNMLKIALKDFDNVTVSDIEFNDTVYLGTYETLRRLKTSDEMYFVMGYDNLTKLDTWLNLNKLLNEFNFIILNREKENVLDFIRNHPLLKDYENHFVIFEDFHYKSSSTEFRETLNKDLVPELVYEYIINNNLHLNWKDKDEK